jgi:nitroimidazol reductase NimA-like FMN-containing flavoprotein (pyridoxamine 5'-phosphate oxidase superfamily)
MASVEESPSPSVSPSTRAEVRRLTERASYEREVAYPILDEGIVCHVGLATDEGPVVIPMAYARDGDRLLVHGSVASRLLRAAGSGVDVCVTVTLVDGLVLARSAFHHSVNYRSVVIFGRATRIDDLDERRTALERVVERLVPGRTTDARGPNERELRATTVLALPLDEISVKVRTGPPREDDEDLELPVWAGVIPLAITPGAPIPDPTMPTADPPPVPHYARTYRRPGQA